MSLLLLGAGVAAAPAAVCYLHHRIHSSSTPWVPVVRDAISPVYPARQGVKHALPEAPGRRRRRPASVGGAHFGQASSGVVDMRVFRERWRPIAVCLALSGLPGRRQGAPARTRTARRRRRPPRRRPPRRRPRAGPAIKGDTFTVNVPEGGRRTRPSAPTSSTSTPARRGTDALYVGDRPARCARWTRSPRTTSHVSPPPATKRKWPPTRHRRGAGVPLHREGRVPATSRRSSAWSTTAAQVDAPACALRHEGRAPGGHRLDPGQLGVEVAAALRRRPAGRTAPARAPGLVAGVGRTARWRAARASSR